MDINFNIAHLQVFHLSFLGRLDNDWRRAVDKDKDFETT